jgi:hypothetical protein
MKDTRMTENRVSEIANSLALVLMNTLAWDEPFEREHIEAICEKLKEKLNEYCGND